MSENQAETWATEADRKKDLRRRKIGEIKSRLSMFAHSCFWGFLNTTRLNRPYSKTMCKLNLYRKFPDGRCMYCGKTKPSRTEEQK